MKNPFRYLLVLLAFYPELIAANLWYRLPVSQQSEFWLVCFEEDEFIRNKIGDWLPMRIYSSDGTELSFCFKELKRVDNKTSFIIRIRTKGGREIELGTSPFHDKGSDEQPEAVVYQQDTDLFVSVRMGDGSERRIMFRRGSSLDDLRARTKVSRASAFWDWTRTPTPIVSSLETSNLPIK